MNRLETLQTALEHREAEVMQHQINIDNYRLALAEIEKNYAGDSQLIAFTEQLKSLLASSLVEQRKEIIMRDVIASQLGA